MPKKFSPEHRKSVANPPILYCIIALYSGHTILDRWTTVCCFGPAFVGILRVQTISSRVLTKNRAPSAIVKDHCGVRGSNSSSVPAVIFWHDSWLKIRVKSQVKFNLILICNWDNFWLSIINVFHTQTQFCGVIQFLVLNCCKKKSFNIQAETLEEVYKYGLWYPVIILFVHQAALQSKFLP